MSGYIIDVGKSEISLGLVGQEVFTKKIEAKSLTNEELAKIIGECLLENYGEKPEKLPLHFLVPPKKCIQFFVTVSKGSDSEEYVLEQATSKLTERNLAIENYYYSYQKIAPFVYQFLAINKEDIERYLEIATLLEFELAGVFSWVTLLPKLLKDSSKAAIFVLNAEGNGVLALSELGGIYHLGYLDDVSGFEEVSDLVEKLSIYQRKKPITKVYTLNFPDLNLGPSFDIDELNLSSPTQLYGKVFSESLLKSQLNLLNMLPLPAIKKTPPLAYVGSVLGGMFGLVKYAKMGESVEQVPGTQSSVLSEVEESTQSTQSEDVQNVQQEEKTEEILEEVELNKGYLRVRVENGTQISGLAASTQDFLLDEGYDVVGIGDSDEEDREATRVVFNKENTIYRDVLVEDLKKKFNSVEIEDSLNGNLDYDVLIIAGSDGADE